MLYIIVEGKEYEFDQNRIMFQEMVRIQAQTGMGFDKLQEGLSKGDPTALGIMVWLCKWRAGEKIKFSELDFDMLTLEYRDTDAEAVEAAKAEAEAEGKDVNPTQSRQRKRNGKTLPAAVTE